MLDFKSNGTIKKLLTDDDVKVTKIDLEEGITLECSLGQATLNFNSTNNHALTGGGWNRIGTIPEGYRPSHLCYAVLYDNSKNSYSDGGFLILEITPEGYVRIWGFSDKLNVDPRGQITWKY